MQLDWASQQWRHMRGSGKRAPPWLRPEAGRIADNARKHACTNAFAHICARRKAKVRCACVHTTTHAARRRCEDGKGGGRAEAQLKKINL